MGASLVGLRPGTWGIGIMSPYYPLSGVAKRVIDAGGNVAVAIGGLIVCSLMPWLLPYHRKIGRNDLQFCGVFLIPVQENEFAARSFLLHLRETIENHPFWSI